MAPELSVWAQFLAHCCKFDELDPSSDRWVLAPDGTAMTQSQGGRSLGSQRQRCERARSVIGRGSGHSAPRVGSLPNLSGKLILYIYSYGKSQSSVGKSSINIGISISICYSFLEGTSMTRNMSDNNKKRRSPDEFIWAVDHFWWEVLFSEQIVTSTGG